MNLILTGKEIFRNVFINNLNKINRPSYINNALYLSQKLSYWLLVVEDKLSMAHG